MRERLNRLLAWLGESKGPPGWMIQTAQGVAVIAIWIAAALGSESARRLWVEGGATITAYITATFGLWQLARRYPKGKAEEGSSAG